MMDIAEWSAVTCDHLKPELNVPLALVRLAQKPAVVMTN